MSADDDHAMPPPGEFGADQAHVTLDARELRGDHDVSNNEFSSHESPVPLPNEESRDSESSRSRTSARRGKPIRYSTCVLVGVRSRWNQSRTLLVGRGGASLAAAIVALQIAVGWLLSNDMDAAIAAAVVIPAFAVLIIRPHWLWLIAFPANYLYWRVGPSRVDLSLADVTVVLATVAALPSVPWRSPIAGLRRSHAQVSRAQAAPRYRGRIRGPA